MANRTTGILETLRSHEPQRFEELIGDIWQECQGWTTKVQQQSRDKGADIVGQPPGSPSQKTIVQAKRYAEGNKVTSEEVQQYAALRQQYSDVTGVTIVTTSSFTRPAEELADRLDVKCIDGTDLVRLIQREDAMKIVEWYAAGKPEDWHRG